MFGNCTGCHSATGNANFAVGSVASTYNQLLTALAKDGVSHYVVAHDPANSVMYHRITNGGASEPNARMPLGGATSSPATPTPRPTASPTRPK